MRLYVLERERERERERMTEGEPKSLNNRIPFILEFLNYYLMLSTFNVFNVR